MSDLAVISQNVIDEFTLYKEFIKPSPLVSAVFQMKIKNMLSELTPSEKEIVIDNVATHFNIKL